MRTVDELNTEIRADFRAVATKTLEDGWVPALVLGVLTPAFAPSLVWGLVAFVAVMGLSLAHAIGYHYGRLALVRKQ